MQLEKYKKIMDDTTVSTADAVVYRNDEEAGEVAEPARVRIHMTQERMEGLKVGIWRRAQNNDMDAMITLLARFVVDESGRWIPKDKAIEALDELTFSELAEAWGQLPWVINDDNDTWLWSLRWEAYNGAMAQAQRNKANRAKVKKHR